MCICNYKWNREVRMKITLLNLCNLPIYRGDSKTPYLIILEYSKVVKSMFPNSPPVHKSLYYQLLTSPSSARGGSSTFRKGDRGGEFYFLKLTPPVISIWLTLSITNLKIIELHKMLYVILSLTILFYSYLW